MPCDTNVDFSKVDTVE